MEKKKKKRKRVLQNGCRRLRWNYDDSIRLAAEMNEEEKKSLVDLEVTTDGGW